jgi:hypothetical protein
MKLILVMVLPIIAIVVIAGLLTGVVSAEAYIIYDIIGSCTGRRQTSNVRSDPYDRNGPGGR